MYIVQYTGIITFFEETEFSTNSATAQDAASLLFVKIINPVHASAGK